MAGCIARIGAVLVAAVISAAVISLMRRRTARQFLRRASAMLREIRKGEVE